MVEESGAPLNKLDNTQLCAAIVAIISAQQGLTTGDIKLTLKAVADPGWVMCDDGTIGPSGSAATTRANADCQALYTLLWNNVGNAHAPVTGGRGASAAADWAAGKTIALTKMLGRALALAGSGATLTARALGLATGAETHTLLIGEIPSHTHPAYNQSNGGILNNGSTTYTTTQGNANTTSTSVTLPAGSGGAHNNMQPTAFVNAMVKL